MLTLNSFGSTDSPFPKPCKLNSHGVHWSTSIIFPHRLAAPFKPECSLEVLYFVLPILSHQSSLHKGSTHYVRSSQQRAAGLPQMLAIGQRIVPAAMTHAGAIRSWDREVIGAEIQCLRAHLQGWSDCVDCGHWIVEDDDNRMRASSVVVFSMRVHLGSHGCDFWHFSASWIHAVLLDQQRLFFWSDVWVWQHRFCPLLLLVLLQVHLQLCAIGQLYYWLNLFAILLIAT